MAVQRLSALINPQPCNQQQEQRNWQALNQILQWLESIIQINIDNTTNEITYNLVNLTQVTVEEISVTNIDVTNELTSVTVNVTEVNATTIDVAIINSYQTTYQLLYSGTTQVCPPACGSGSSGSGASGCSEASFIDSLPDTVYLDVTWGGSTSTITLTKYDEVLSTGGLGYAQKRWSGSGSFGAGASAQYKVWAYKGCAPGSTFELYMTHDYCTGVFMADLNDKTTWFSDAAPVESPFYGSVAPGSGGMVACGAYADAPLLEVYP